MSHKRQPRGAEYRSRVNGTGEFRCCYCRTTNKHPDEKWQKTARLYCSGCDDVVLQNQRGA